VNHVVPSLCALCCCWSGLTSSHAAASSHAPALSPAMSSRDAAMIVERLRLNPQDAAPILTALLGDYETQWMAARDHLHAALSTESRNGLRLAAAERIRAFQSTQLALATVLTDDIAALLDDEGRQHWTRLQHDLWRLRRLRYGQFHGEAIDLRLIVDESRTALPSLQSPAVESMVLIWQAELAALLAAREPFDSEGSTRYLALVLDRQYEAALAWMTQWVDLRTAIRSLNLRTAQAIEAALEPADAAAFAADIAQRIAIHTPGGRRVDRVAARVANDESMPESMRGRVADIHAAYRRDTATLNADRERIEQAIEPLAVLAPMQRRTGEDDAWVELVDARQDNELDLQMRAQGALDAICNVIGDARCASLATARSGASAIDRAVHPSGLPQHDPPPTGKPAATPAPAFAPPPSDTPAKPFLPPESDTPRTDPDPELAPPPPDTPSPPFLPPGAETPPPATEPLPPPTTC